MSQLVKTPRIPEPPPIFEHQVKLLDQSTVLRLGIQLVGYRYFILIKNLGENRIPNLCKMSSVYSIMILAIQFPATKKPDEFVSTGFQQF